MKKLLKEYRFLFIFYSLFVVVTIFLAVIKVDYDITTPASITPVATEIDIDSASNDHINTVAVYAYERVSILSYLLAKLNKNVTIEPSYQYSVDDNELAYSSGLIQKKVSIYNAIISGYQKAGYDHIIDNNSFKGYIIHTLYSFASKDLQIGDIIVAFNGQPLKGLTGQNEFEEVTKQLIFNKDAIYQITVDRYVNNQIERLTFDINTSYYYEKEDNKYAALGIYTYEYVVPSLSANLPSYTWQYGNSVGPSGGLMQALYVYECLTGNKLTNGLKIAGTGTVDPYGKAGLIGGIYQKIITAYLSGADIFFIPVTSSDPTLYEKESNYQEAMASYQKLKNKDKMKVYPISSLDDIINYLTTYKR